MPCIPDQNRLATDLGFGHCGHAPKCINEGVMDDRDPLGCCNCGTRKTEEAAACAGPNVSAFDCPAHDPRVAR